MTYEEALKDLKSIHWAKCGLYTDDSFAYEKAFEALEKQIPKHTIQGRCPCCGYELDVWMWCPVCGQHLDWSEE